MIYPKLLLLDVTPIGKNTATGELKAAYFRIWPEECLMHAHAVGDDLALACEDGRHVKLEEASLLQACEAFDPDVILYRCVGDKPRFHEFALNAIAESGKPYTLWLMDDWLDRARQAGHGQFDLFDRDIRALLSRAAGRYVISPRMAEAFGKRYGHNFEVLRNGVETEDWPAPEKASAAGKGFVLRYAGALAPDTARDSVYEVAEVVEALSKTLPVTFEIKTQPVWFKAEAQNYAGFEATTVSVSDLSPEQHRSWLGGGDAVLVAYNFDPATEAYLKYSFANKIPECLASGAAPLVYGPGALSSVEFLESSGAALTVTRRGVEGLKEAIEKLFSDPAYAADLAGAARRIAFENFSLKEQRNILRQRLLAVRETPMRPLTELALLADSQKTGHEGRRLRQMFAGAATVETLPFAQDDARAFDPARFAAAFSDAENPQVQVLNPDQEAGLSSLPPAKQDSSGPRVVRLDFRTGEDASAPAGRLAALGYTIYFSEWYPASPRNARAWRGLQRYPRLPLPENEGELFAFPAPPGEADIAAALLAGGAGSVKFRGVDHAEPLVREGEPTTLVLLGNGPSLKSVDLRSLKGAATLGMNAAFRYWRQIDWWPDYYACLDLVVGISHKEAIADMIENAERLGIEKFLLRDNLISVLGATGYSPRIVNFDRLRKGDEFFQADPITTGSHALLWAASLGFERVLLCGVDGQYEEIVPGAERKRGIELEIASEADNPNYFFAGYQKPGDRYCLPNPRPNLHLGAWRQAARALFGSGTEILNANFASAVDSFDFVELESLRGGGLDVQTAESVFARRDNNGMAFSAADPMQAASGLTFAAGALLDEGGVGVAACDAPEAGKTLRKMGYGVHALAALDTCDLAVVTAGIDIETLKRTILSSRACVILPGGESQHLERLARELRLWGENLYSVDRISAEARVQIYPSDPLTPGASIVCLPGEPVSGEKLQRWIDGAARGARFNRRFRLLMRRKVHFMRSELHGAINRVATHRPLLAHLLKFCLHGGRALLTRPFGLGGGLVIVLAALLLASGAAPAWWPLWILLGLAVAGSIAGYLAASYVFALVSAHNAEKETAERRILQQVANLEQRFDTLNGQHAKALETLKTAKGELQVLEQKTAALAHEDAELERKRRAGLEALSQKLDSDLGELSGRLAASGQEMQTEIAGLKSAFTDASKSLAALETSETALQEAASKQREEVQSVKQSAILHSRLLDGMNAANAAGARHFRRRLQGRDLDEMMERWSKQFGQSYSRQELHYLAHQICLIEDRCRGRMAGEIERIMLRLLALRSLKKDRIEVLEIGTLFGIGGAVFHQLTPAGTRASLTFIDPLSGYYGAGEPDPVTGEMVSRERLDENLQRLGMSPHEDYRVIQAYSESDEAVKAAADRKYDYVLIDGDHSYEGVKRDFELYAPMVEKGGLVIFDDYESPDWPEIARYADDRLKDDPCWEWLGGQWSTGIARRRTRARTAAKAGAAKPAGSGKASPKTGSAKTPASGNSASKKTRS